jgi:AmmeMemoRadiSam system protein B/AmmeMemoRadiSam system protein A
MTKTSVKVWLISALILAWSTPLPRVAGETSPKVRSPAVAGLFYPSGPEELRQTVLALLRKANGVGMPAKIRALVSPHAGYIYSGIVAAAGYKQIDPSIKTVVLLGPSHRVPLRGASIAGVKAYRTPFGDVPLSRLTLTLQELTLFESIPEAHAREHSLEVQLPFLQMVLKDFEIVPILTHRADPKALATALAPHIREDTLVVASSDLSHYYSSETAISLDQICTNAVLGGRLSDMAQCEACGKQAVLTLMHIAKIKDWHAALIDYKNSGDTAGSKNRVVGYASIGFLDGKEVSRKMKETLSAQDRKALLKLARSAIEAKLVKGATVEAPESPCGALTQQRGCFVTLQKRGQLRGCIGTIEPCSSLLECVEGNAQNAAFHDPRFPPLSQGELSEIEIEVSVLSVPERMHFKDGQDLKAKLEPNVHGVILSRGLSRSTFLPQVWKQLPDKEQFLEHLCVKGGMSSKAWQDPDTRVEVYHAEAFGEHDLK